MRITARDLQRCLGALWLIDGCLQLQPAMFSKAFAETVIAPGAERQPHFIAQPILIAAHIIGANPIEWNALFATIQLAIGAGILIRKTVKPALLGSIAWSLAVWWIGEGFGSMFTGTALPLSGAPGPVVLYGLVALIALRPQETTVRQVSAVGWLVLSLSWALPANRTANAAADAISTAWSGEPAWMSHPVQALADASWGHGNAVALIFGLLSALVVLATYVGCRRCAATLGLVIGATYWIVGQAFGAVLTGTATDLNSGPLLMLLALSVCIHDPVTAPETLNGVTTWPTAVALR